MPNNGVGGNPGKNQWQLADRHAESENDGQSKMMMLTTDMCLAYGFTRKMKECVAAKFEVLYPRAYGPHCETLEDSWHVQCKTTRVYKASKINYCRANYEYGGPHDQDRETILGWEDLDPLKHNCCAWVSRFAVLHLNLAPSNYTTWDRFQQVSKYKEIDFCGRTVQFDDNFHKELMDNDDCCAHHEHTWQDHFDCDNQYSPKGMSYFDVADFAREVEVWYRWYLKAWSIAHENGYDDLECLSKECETRFEPTEKESLTCPDYPEFD